MFMVGVQSDSYLLVVVNGQGTLAHFCGAIKMLREILDQQQQNKALLDLMGAIPQLSAEEHVQLGQFLAEALDGCITAVAVAENQRTYLGELAAVLAGAQVRTFSTLHEAEAWLLDARTTAG